MPFSSFLPEKRWRICAVAILCLIGAYLRVKDLMPASIWPDEALYLWCGKRLAEHISLLFSAEIITYHPPGFPLLLALLTRSFPGQIAAYALSPLCAIAGIPLTYIAGKKMHGTFVGMFAALMITFHYYHRAFSTRILMESCLVTGFLVLSCLMLTHTERPSRRTALGIVFTAAALVWIKWSGLTGLVMILLWLLIHYIETKDQQACITLGRITGGVIILIAPLFIANIHALGSYMPDLSALHGVYYQRPGWYYLAQLLPYATAPGSLFFIIGLLALRKTPSPTRAVLISWLAAFFLIIPFFGEKEFRHMLPLLPAISVITGIGLAQTIQHFCRGTQCHRWQYATLGCFLLFHLAILPTVNNEINTSKHRGTGFREASIWIRENTMPETHIIAGSSRAIRLYTNINFTRFGGKLITFDQNKESFIELLNTYTATPLILEIDIWDFAQPAWIRPITQDTIDEFKKMGFHLEKTVIRLVNINGTLQQRPVVYLFRKP